MQKKAYSKEVEPSQKWHFIEAYASKKHRDDKFYYGRLNVQNYCFGWHSKQEKDLLEEQIRNQCEGIKPILDLGNVGDDCKINFLK